MIPTHIIIHHSATKDSGTKSWDAIRRYHVEEKGWDDIGYHWGIERIGDNDFQWFKGRPENVPGAHCVGMNGKSLGICCVGDYDVIFPPPVMVDALVVKVKELMDKYNIPLKNVNPHNKYVNKTCPGKEFPWWLFKQQLTGMF